MTVYLDAIWVLNFLLDFMLLMLTQLLAKVYVRKVRLCFGALVASLLVPISLYLPESFFTSVPGKLLYSMLIIVCAFRYTTIAGTIKLLLLFYFTSFSVGGALIAAHYLTQSPIGLSQAGIITFEKGFGDPVSWLFVIIGFPIAWYFTKARMDKHAIEKIRYDQMYPVTISIKEQLYSTTGYIDSGNQLVDPLTRKAVVICDETFLLQWFTKDEWEMLKTAHEQLDVTMLPKAWEKEIQLIPYQGVEGGGRFLFAIKPDYLVIYHDDKRITTNKVLIGIQFANLTKDQTYHCLLNPQIFSLTAVETA